MPDFYPVIAPVLRSLDAEWAHRLTIAGLRTGLGPKASFSPPENLRCRIWNLEFPNPVGLAAGFDKNAEVPLAMLAMGLGFTEVGTVTPRPQTGNARPRLFRLSEDRAVINRMGFNNDGLKEVARRLSYIRNRNGIVGANIGANKDSGDRIADYVTGLRRLWTLADYFTVNISSPNTPGLRGLQERDALTSLLDEIGRVRSELERAKNVTKPVLVKVAPDLDGKSVDDIAEIVMAQKVDGLIVGNTTIARPASLTSRHAPQQGGLSGAPLMTPSTEILSSFYRRTEGRLPLVGVGGISSAADAYAKIRAGASLVQLYSALAFDGPSLIGEIITGLSGMLARDGFSKLEDAVGIDHR